MRGRLLAAAALVAALPLAGCHVSDGCAADVCTVGTVRRAAPAVERWAVQGDDGTTYDVVPALPALFRRDGLRVRIVARNHGGRAADGARPIEVVRIETQ